MSGSITSEPLNSVLTDSRWRWRHSAWLLAPILGFGYFSFVGFAYCAIRIQERKWTVLAVASSGLTLLGWILAIAWTDSLGDPSNAAIVFIIDLWIASIVMATVVNSDYLRWRATRPDAISTRPAQQHVRRLAPVVGSLPPAGWYVDPADEQRVRYWNGSAWTEFNLPK